MNETPINQSDQELIDIALEIIQKRQSEISTVGSALRTTDGKVFTGVNIEALRTSSCSMCAEYPAIGQMYKDGSEEIETIVAILSNGNILPPCGSCRELLTQFGNPFVILHKNGNPIKVKLNELIPYENIEKAT